MDPTELVELNGHSDIVTRSLGFGRCEMKLMERNYSMTDRPPPLALAVARQNLIRLAMLRTLP